MDANANPAPSPVLRRVIDRAVGQERQRIVTIIGQRLATAATHGDTLVVTALSGLLAEIGAAPDASPASTAPKGRPSITILPGLEDEPFVAFFAEDAGIVDQFAPVRERADEEVEAALRAQRLRTGLSATALGE